MESSKVKAKTMVTTQGIFEVELSPQSDEIPAGRMLIEKTFTGGLVGTGRGQMVSKQIEGGQAVYFAVEEFSGSVDGMSGSFTFLHKGVMDQVSQSLEIHVMTGSGQGELEGLEGKLSLDIVDGVHNYTFDYKL